MSAVSIRLRGISKRFGAFQAIDQVSLEVRAGEFYSLLGPSGCGKTTLLRILAGFEEPDAGSIELDGQPMLGVPPNRRHVNTVFQNYALFPHLSVFENVAFPLRLRRVPKAQLRDEVLEQLRLVQLEDQGAKFPSQLSGGQKQRVAIARALINHPGALLLDEPLSALDAKLRASVLFELEKLHERVGITFLLVTHDQQEALSISDHVAIMQQGRLLQVGTPTEVYERPRSVFVASFIGETNLVDGTVRGNGGGVVSIDTPQGLWRVRSELTPAPGTRVLLTLRPERIRLVERKVDHEIEAVVDELAYTGALTRLFLKTPAGLLQVLLQGHGGPRYHKGQVVCATWDEDAPWLVEVLPP